MSSYYNRRYMVSKNYYKSSALFVVLINMNQTYFYYAPVYFVYLLTSCCNPQRLPYIDVKKNFLRLSTVVLVGFVVSLCAFIPSGEIIDVYAKQFPLFFGLIFADFWAPNTWALYTGFDLFMIARNYPDAEHDSETRCTSAVRQAVGAFVPKLNTAHISLLVCLFLTPILRKLWKSPDKPLVFLHAVVLCCFTQFMFGWYGY